MFTMKQRDKTIEVNKNMLNVHIKDHNMAYNKI